MSQILIAAGRTALWSPHLLSHMQGPLPGCSTCYQSKLASDTVDIIRKASIHQIRSAECLLTTTAPCRGVLHDEGHLSQMMDLATAAADPAAGSFVVPTGQCQARIRFGPEPSPLKR